MKVVTVEVIVVVEDDEAQHVESTILNILQAQINTDALPGWQSYTTTVDLDS